MDRNEQMRSIAAGFVERHGAETLAAMDREELSVIVYDDLPHLSSFTGEWVIDHIQIAVGTYGQS